MHLKPMVAVSILVPLPRAGRVNQSCLTADIWFHSESGNMIPHRSKGQPTVRGA